jgi:hypothetical protein
MNGILKRVLLLPVITLFLAGNLSAQPYYVSATGSDSNAGTITSPFLTITKAVSLVQAGQTIYVRGGTHNLTTTISIAKSGTENARISLLAYTGERPVLDFSAQSLSSGNRGVVLSGSYWTIKGLDITGAGDNGMVISGGNNNIIELCNFYRNRDSGLQIDNGAAGNTIRNCDSYFNADPPDFGDADGFAPKLTVGTGNTFYGCRAWRNCDDGWDGYLRGADDMTTTLENCWSFENGYFEDGQDAGELANGNGFKMGGSDDKTLKHNFILKNCLAFGNKAKGFDQNNNKGSMTLYNCTGHDNDVDNYRINQVLADGKVLILKNCAEYGSKISLGAFAVQEKNSWLSPFVVTAEDFRTLDPAGATAVRQSDGRLPYIDYMHLASGSDLIDAGVNVGLVYAGSAPDLGCFETGLTSAGTGTTQDKKVVCYPNPVTTVGFVNFTTGKGGRCVIILYDITGRPVRKLADRIVDSGENSVRFDLSDAPEGLYIYRIILNGNPLFVGRLIKNSLPG